MVSPIMRRVPAHQYDAPRTEERKTSPEAMTIVSPISSTVDTPSTIGQITPTRRLLFERRAPRDSSVSQQSLADSVESRQEAEIQDLRLSNKRKDNQLRVLHQRFQNIQQGLGSIDQERNNLVEKAKKLEKEKRHIQKQLELREREILALVKRCASQEEKMRESSRLRAQNKELAQALESVQSQLSDSDQEREDLKSLRSRLQESELAREELQDRLRKVQREHDSIADTLQQCLANIRKLTEEKEQIEEDRRRERKLAEIEMEKQRLAHAQEANGWKEDLENKQLKIDQMERILQENMFTKTSLRREKAIRQEETQEAIEKYEKKIAELQEELDRRSDYMDEDYETTLLLLRRKIEEKDALMAGLENEFSGQMGELMKKQSSLDEAEEEKKHLETKVEQLEKLECEYSALQEYVRILDSNLADLTSENAYLILDKESLEEETERLQQKMKELEFQLSRHHQHNDENDAGKGQQREELEVALAQARNEVTSLQSELASRARWISKLEMELKEARREVVQKEEEIRKIQHEKEEISNTLQFSLAEARKEVAQLEAELQFRDHQLKMVKHTLDNERFEYAQQEEQLKDLETKIFHSSDAQSREQVVSDGREPPPAEDTVERDLERLELEQRVKETENIVENLKQQIKSLTTNAENERKSKSEIEKKKRDLEISLQKAHIELRSYREQVQSLKHLNSLLETEAEAIRLSSTRSDEESEKNTSQTKSLETELSEAYKALKEKECAIQRLEVDLKSLQQEKQSFAKSLDEAHGTIKSLENKLVDRSESILEKQLKAAQVALSEQQSKTQKMEEQYSSAVDIQSRREVYNRQASSRIAVLENQIMDLQETQSDLKTQLQQSAKAVESKDRQLKLFELEKEEYEKRSCKQQEQLDEERIIRTGLEQELAKKKDLNSLLKLELDDTMKALTAHEKKIEEMENDLSQNEKLRSELKLKLSESSAKIGSLEEEITCLATKSNSLDEQLQSALKNLSNNEAFVRDAELKMAEKSLAVTKMEKEVDVAMKSKVEAEKKLSICESRLVSLEEQLTVFDQKNRTLQDDLRTSNEGIAKAEEAKDALYKNIVALEKELVDNKMLSDDQFQKLEAQHSDACKRLAEKQTLIQSLEDSIRVGTEEMDRVNLELSDCREAIELLEQEITKRDVRIKGLEKEVEDLSKNDIEMLFVESEEKRMELERLLQESRTKITELTKNLDDRESRVLELDQRLEETFKEKSKQEQRADESVERCSELQDRIRDLDELIESREAQLLSIGDELSAAQKSVLDKDNESKNLQHVISSLESTLDDAKKNARAVQEELELQLSEERERSTQASTKLAMVEAKLLEESQRAARYQGMVTEQEDKIVLLRTDLRETIETKDKEYREKEAALKVEIAKLETSVALKDDEIQELRVIELKDKEETIVALSEALERLKDQTEASEVEMTRAVNELKRENKKLRDRVDGQDRDATITREKYTAQISKMERQINDLEACKHKIEGQLAEQDGKLRERHNIISQLTKREAELEQQERILLSSCEQLVKSETAAKEELERMKNALDVSIMRSKEDLDLQRHELEAQHRKEVTDLSSKLRTTEMKLSETDSVLKERTSLLSEMVEHNKDLESKLDKQQAQISAMEEETSRCRADLSETQTELMRAREDLCKRENALTSKLNEERIHRDNAERALSKLKVQIVDASKAKKLVSDLEKDNQALKDKIIRQEAYLQRKLQKEKIQRGRVTPVSSGARTPVSKSSSSYCGSSCQTPPKPTRPSPVRLHSGSKIPVIPHDTSQRSSRSISTALPRSGIPSLSTARSSETKGNVFEPIKRDSWELDVE